MTGWEFVHLPSHDLPKPDQVPIKLHLGVGVVAADAETTDTPIATNVTNATKKLCFVFIVRLLSIA
jgi:hypothetical protein